jgi:glucosylceramidase
MQLFSSSPAAQWVERHLPSPTTLAPLLHEDGVVTPCFKGFGACFNELGWIALNKLGENARAEILGELFGADGLALNYCRLPIGANDYSESWYSHNEVDGDYAMENFSIARDHQMLVPFIEAARKVRGQDFFLFASPWSPPTWMKHPKAYNYGILNFDQRTRKAYADYFVRFVKAYRDIGIPIDAVHVQNEPNSDQKFPSCVWTGAKMRDFIRDDLGPAFEAAGVSTEIWAGTIERGDFNAWPQTILSDPGAAKFVAGFGFQWAGKHAVQRTRQAYPQVPLIQTENECGDGENTWAYAHYVFDLVQHYLSNGAEAYVYWNMVLETGGISTWGWKQNSLYCVDPDGRGFVRNPEYYVMRHAAAFVRPGASVLSVKGAWAGNALAFANPDGTKVFVLQNPFDDARDIPVQIGGETYLCHLEPKSFTTLRV